MKGSLEGILPMLGLLLTAVILTVQTIPIGEAFNSVVGESSEDIEKLVETQTSYDYTVEHYIPSSMEYSVNNAAYELDDGGINWKSEASSALTPNSILNSILDSWESEAYSRFDTRLDNAGCSIGEDIDFELYPGSSEPGYDFFSTEFENVSALSTDFSGLNILCHQDAVLKTESYSQSISTPNRYIELAKAGSEFFYELEETFDDASIEDSYTNTRTACGSRSSARSSARSAGVSSYFSDVPSVSSIESSLSLPSGISSSSSQENNYNWNEVSSSSGSCCRTRCTRRVNGTCVSRTCTANTKSSTVEVTPTNTVIDFEVEDIDEEVLTEDGYLNLEIGESGYVINH